MFSISTDRVHYLYEALEEVQRHRHEFKEPVFDLLNDDDDDDDKTPKSPSLLRQAENGNESQSADENNRDHRGIKRPCVTTPTNSTFVFINIFK